MKEATTGQCPDKLTATGKPLLANDPHRTIAIPSLRYVVHLVAPGWDVIGATEPALPGVSIGHNENIAWGLTVFPVDQEDLYLEDLNPADPLQYKTENGWARMSVEETTIAIRGAAARQVQLKFTRHGAVLWEDRETRAGVAVDRDGAGTVPYSGGAFGGSREELERVFDRDAAMEVTAGKSGRTRTAREISGSNRPG